jgi:hypothetical protein
MRMIFLLGLDMGLDMGLDGGLAARRKKRRLAVDRMKPRRKAEEARGFNFPTEIAILLRLDGSGQSKVGFECCGRAGFRRGESGVRSRTTADPPAAFAAKNAATFAQDDKAFMMPALMHL